MKLAHFALNNIRRTPMRAGLTAISVLIAAATLSVVLALERGYSGAVKRELVDKTGVHLYITKENCPIEAASVVAQGGLSPLYVEESLMSVVQGIDGISAALPFQLFSETATDGTRTDIFMGVTEAIGKVRPDWVIENGGWFTDDNSVILGAQIARIELAKVGDKLYSEQLDREFRVTGILRRSYSQDDGIIFLPLATAQKLVKREGRLSAIALKLHDVGRVHEVTTRLRGTLAQDYSVISAKELSEGILGFFAATRMIMFVMVGVAFGVSIFGIVNTMLMVVMERRREIAYLKCLGARRADVLRLITLETLIICFAGGAGGILAGALVTPAAASLLRGTLAGYVPKGSIAAASPDIALLALSVTVAVGIFCALYPAWKAASIVPMEVLRNE